VRPAHRPAPHRSLRILAGPRARARIEREGLAAADVAALAGAAGGPKGLVFLPLDEHLFGAWLPRAPRPRLLAGASIGAWRMAAAVHPERIAAIRRLGEAYLEFQRYPLRPGPAHVAQVCARIVEHVLGDAHRFVAAADPAHSLAVITARARGPIAARTGRLAFARTAAANLVSRRRLGAHLQRTVFELGPRDPAPAAVGDLPAAQPLAAPRAPWPADGFDTQHVRIDAGNARDALLASGTIPLLADPVRNPAGAPPGTYWDGGLIDYHLFLDWRGLDGLVLYPHFTPHLTPGWLDKGLPWRRRGLRGAAAWLDNLVLLVPSDALLARLPNRKLPDRGDFAHYGLDHDRRLRDWRRAIDECRRMVDEFEAFCARPDPLLIEPLGRAP